MQDIIALRRVNHPNLAKQVSIATVQDKRNVSSAQKVSSVRTLLQNPQHAQRVFTVLRVMRRVQYVPRGTSVQMVHHQGCVLLDSRHPSVPQHARHVLQVIDALIKECLPQRAAPKDSTQIRHCKWDVILAKLVGNAQMVINLCRARLATSVNMASPTARHVSQDITAALVHPCVCHVLLENSVLTPPLIQ